MIPGPRRTRSAARPAARVRVLVADDDAVLRALVVGVVQEEPGLWLVGAAANGERALRLGLALRPDLLVTDHDLGDMTAEDVVHGLRSVGARPRVLLHSGRSDVHEIGERLGAAASVHKAEGVGRLIEALRALVRP